jgi:protein-disulfide isomerase
MTTTPPAGWYPDENPSRERWWDGTAWTEHLRDAPRASAGPAAPSGPAASAGPGAFEPGARAKRPVWPWVLGGSVVVVIAIIVTAVLILTSVLSSLQRSSSSTDSSDRSDSQSSSAGAPRGATNDGIVVGSGGEDAVRVVTYVDYFCPFCGQFESTNGEQLSEWVESGDVVLEVHPIAILDRASLGTKYSTRAANAAACVADSSPGAFESFSALLFAKQPAENTEGLSDADLVDIAEEAGAAESSGVRECIQSGQFEEWVTDATDRALHEPIPNSDLDKVSGTPTVLVDGVQYTGGLTDAAEFADFVESNSR